MSVCSTITKTVYNPYTDSWFVLVTCDACGGSGQYWRGHEDISDWWPCHKCEGHGCVTLEEQHNVRPHPHANDIPYRPRKGVA